MSLPALPIITTAINAVSTAASIGGSAYAFKTMTANFLKRYDLHYPLSLTGISAAESEAESTLDLKRPTIIFTRNKRDIDAPLKIAFPIPQGLDFSDGAGYDDQPLNFVVSGLMGAVQSGMATSKQGGDMNSIIGSSIDSLKQSFTSDSRGYGMVGAEILKSMGKLSDDNKTAIGIAMKATINKHVTTEFTGVGTRNYAFKFKMIGSSAAESKMIRDICNAFREGLYPEGDNIALHYPPTWTIRFLLGRDDISYLPKIWECYLTTLNVSYNGSAGLWHEDGSPLECDISVSFKETRALTYKDIRDLEKSSFVGITNKNNRQIAKEASIPTTNTTTDKQGSPPVAKR